MKILIVDDSRTMRKIIKRTLRNAGYGEHDFCEAEDGAEALDTIARRQPDLILCDWNMPEMSGIELLRSMRGNGWNIPFGFITSERTDERRRQARDAGALFLMAKPFTPEAFRHVLAPILAS